jgi:gliding motility-associated lipoprotein GldH
MTIPEHNTPGYKAPVTGNLMIKKTIYRILLCLISCALCLTSCFDIDLYEKNVTVPRFKWQAGYQPEFDFTITDTTSLYQLYFVIRHNEKYEFNNIWFNLYSQPPGDTVHKTLYEVKLATNDGWLGAGMDDIYEHRHALTEPLRLRAGNYHFKLEQMMRQDPLANVMNVGLRVEKKQ